MKRSFPPMGTGRSVNQTGAKMGKAFRQTAGPKGRAPHAACGKRQTSKTVPAQGKPTKG